MIRIEGLDGLLAKLAAMPQAVGAAVARDVQAGARNVQAGAKQRVPVDTGRLRSSIAVETSDDGLSATVGTNVFYGPWAEFGTRRQAAKPFLFPALEQEVPKFMSRLRARVRKALGGR
jgi:HK97 gp10 family phage protein